MAIDNFVPIANMLYKLNKEYSSEDFENHVYQIQIILRKNDKDIHKVETKGDYCVHIIQVENPTELLRKKKFIVQMCEALGARAMINLTPKSLRKANSTLFNRLSGYMVEMINGNYVPNGCSPGLGSSAIESIRGSKNLYHLYMIDIDNVSYSDALKIANDYRRSSKEDISYIGLIQSNSGWHAISPQFNYGKHDDNIKTSCLVNLYIPTTDSETYSIVFDEYTSEKIRNTDNTFVELVDILIINALCNEDTIITDNASILTKVLTCVFNCDTDMDIDIDLVKFYISNEIVESTVSNYVLYVNINKRELYNPLVDKKYIHANCSVWDSKLQTVLNNN